MLETEWHAAPPVCAVGAGVFCFFGLEVQEDFVVGEEGGLGVFYLGVLAWLWLVV